MLPLNCQFVIQMQEEIGGVPELDETAIHLTDYTCFKVLDGSLGLKNCIGIVRGFMTGLNSSMDGEEFCLDTVLVHLPDHYECIDLSMYKVIELWCIYRIIMNVLIYRISSVAHLL
jgi:hypothetical protein